MSVPLIETKNLHKWFEEVHALDDVNLEIYPGEIVGLVGDNGAGKSTLIKILSGIFRQTEGEIYYKGKKVKSFSVKSARELGIETVYQDKAVIDDLDVAKNIFIGRELVARSIGPIKIVNKKAMDEESIKLMRHLQLMVSPNQEVRFCSGGEKQGVAISRAMQFNAKLIMLDEPFSALSVKGVREVVKFIEKLKEKKIAVILVTHTPFQIYSVATRFVIFMKGKKIVDIKKEDTSLSELERILIEERG